MRLVAIQIVRPSAPKRKVAMNVLKAEKQLAVISALVEGVSIRSIERLTGIHRDTIMRLTVRVGEHCQRIMAERMKGLRCQRVLDVLPEEAGPADLRGTPRARPGRPIRVRRD
jgi:predicted nucleic acid-binding protein